MAKLPTLNEFRKDLKVWSIPAMVAVLTPTFDLLFSYSLISEYYQPELQLTSSAIGALSCLIIYALLVGRTVKIVSWVLASVVIVFLVSLFGCLAFQELSLAQHVPEIWQKDTINFLNMVLYVLVFSASSMILMCVFLLLPHNRREN